MGKLFLYIVLFFSLWAEEIHPDFGKPIPQEQWDIRQDVEKDIYDAVLIKDYYSFGYEEIHRYQRYRILNDDGKFYAQLPAFGDELISLQGRVIDIAGKESTFSDKENLIEMLALKIKNEKVSQKVIIPPGITSNCIVEVDWKVKAYKGIERGESMHVYKVNESIHCVQKVFRIQESMFKQDRSRMVVRFAATNIALPATAKKTNQGKDIVMTYTNISPYHYQPYSHELLDKRVAKFQLFRVNGFLNYPKVDDFWNKYSELLVQRDFDVNYKKSKKLKVWLDDLKSKMLLQPDHPASFVFDEFNKTFKSLANIEGKLLKKTQAVYKNNHLKDMQKKYFKLGYIPIYMVPEIMFDVYQSLGFDVKIIYTVNTTKNQFFPFEKNPYKLMLKYPLLLVSYPGKASMLIAPKERFMPAGYVDPVQRGDRALMINPNNGWAAKIIRVDKLGTGIHTKMHYLNTKIDIDDTITTNIQYTGTGVYYDKSFIRFKYMDKDEKEKYISRYWEKKLGDFWEVSQPVLLENDSMMMQVNAVKKPIFNSDAFLMMDPFPGIPFPVSVSRFWEKERTTKVSFLYAFVQADNASITLPQSWKLMGDPSWEKSNAIGEIKFIVRQQADKIELFREIKMHQANYKPDKQEAIQQWLSWVHRAFTQELAIQRGEQ